MADSSAPLVSHLLVRLQCAIIDHSTMTTSHGTALRNLRDKFVSFENLQLRVLRLERALRALQAAEAHFSTPSNSPSAPTSPSPTPATSNHRSSNSSATSPSPPRPPGPPPPRVPTAGSTASAARMVFSKPFGYSYEVSSRRLLLQLRSEPRPLARALARASVLETLDRERAAALARTVVHDVFGQRHEGALVRLLGDCMRHVAELRVESPGALLPHHSLVNKLLHEYLALVGRPYLEAIALPTIARVVCDEELHVDLAGRSPDSGPPSPTEQERAAAAAQSDMPMASTTAALVRACGELLHRILQSAELLPFGVRYLATLLGQLESERGDPDSPPPPEKTTGDFIYLSWVAHAVMHPENHGLAFHLPISRLSRRNLQLIGTVLIKLVIHSRFKAFEHEHLAPLNLFLDEMMPLFQRLLTELAVDLDSLSHHFVQINDRVTVKFGETGQPSRLGCFDPLAVQPNQLFDLHSVLQAWADAEETDDAVSSIAADFLSRLGAVPRSLPEERNDYTLLDIGLPSLAAAADLLSQDDDAELAEAAGSPEEHECFRMLTSILASMPPLRGRPTVTSVSEFFEQEARVAQDLGAPARAASLLECTRLLREMLPAEMQEDGFRPLLERLLRIYEARRERLLHSDLPQMMILSQGIIDESTSALRFREHACTEAFTTLQTRHALHAALPKVRALRRLLDRRRAEQGPPACGGPCPVSFDDDRFLCRNCDDHLKNAMRTMISFRKKYAIDRGRPFGGEAQLLGHALDLQGAHFANAVTDFVAACQPEHFLVRCRAADDSMYRMLEELKERFSDFGSFHRAVCSDEVRLEEDDDGQEENDAGDAEPKLPTLGQQMVDSAVQTLTKVHKQHSLHDKLECFRSVRALISAVMQHVPRAVGGSFERHSGADDYMPILCYTIMLANPVRFVSDVQTVQMLLPESLSVKGFVDTLVAIKYLINLQESVHKALAAKNPPPADTGDTPTPMFPPGSSPAAPEQELLAAQAAFISSPIAAQLRKQMSEMGFPEEDTNAGLEALALTITTEEMHRDGGFQRLLDFLTDLTCLLEMGYARDDSVRALLATGHNVSRAVQFLVASEQQDAGAKPT